MASKVNRRRERDGPAEGEEVLLRYFERSKVSEGKKKAKAASSPRRAAIYIFLSIPLSSAFSLVWFLLTIFATMLTMIALFTPHWLISPSASEVESAYNTTVLRYPSFGLSSRCKKVSSGSWECATFSVMATSTRIFPFFWKLSYVFMALGFALLTMTCLCTICSCCRQSFLGKSLHTVTGSVQILSGIFVMIAIFLYPLGWSVERIASVCVDISPFFPGECALGYSFYSAIAAIVVAFLCGVLSLKAEKANMNPSIKRRIEEGNERLVFAP